MVRNTLNIKQAEYNMAQLKKRAHKALDKGNFELYSKLIQDAANIEAVLESEKMKVVK